MAIIVAPGRRIRHNKEWFLEGDVFPGTRKEAESLLVDGALIEDQTIHRVEPPSSSTVNESKTLILNDATDAELRSLPHVGAGIAKKLRDARPFESLTAARVASGLTDEQWSQIEPLVTL